MGMAQEDRKVGRFGDGTDEVIGALIEVHRQLGPGLMESAYEACLCAGLCERGLDFERQRSLPINYKGVRVESAYRLDVVVGGCVLLELESVERLLPIHEAQVITYLRLSRLPVGLLVNFNVTALRNGLRRLTPEHPKSLKTFRSSDLPVQSK
jgi:GxxExxY protein